MSTCLPTDTTGRPAAFTGFIQRASAFADSSFLPFWRQAVGRFKPLLAGVALASAAPAQTTMTFDALADGTPMPFGSRYAENGLVATIDSNNAVIGDPLHAEAGSKYLYFHGSNEYIEFSLENGGSFTLNSFKFVTNGFAPRLIATSNSNGTLSLADPTSVSILPFSGPAYENITWFRVGTPFFATQIDNVTVTPLQPEPPSIVTEPLPAQTVAAGGQVTLTVAVRGVPTPAVQWFKNSQAIGGATDATLAFDAVAPADAGTYTAVATNASGSVTSNPTTLQVTVPSPVQPPNGIVAWWHFDETNGAIAADAVGNHPGAFANSPVPTAGRVRGALSFNGSNYVSVADSSAWAFGTNNFAIETWALFSTPPGGSVGHPDCIFVGSDEGGGTRNKWFFALGGGMLNFHVNSPVTGGKFLPLVPFTPIVGRWYHLAVVRSGSTYTIFVNGVAAGSATNSDPLPDANAPLTIGEAEELGYMKGALDELTIYDRALAPEEIAAIYQAGAAGKAVGLAATPATGGNTGVVTVHLTGTKFAAGATVELVRLGETAIAGSTAALGVDGISLETTFDLHGQPAGTWDIVVTNPDGSSVTLPNGFTVEAQSAPKVWTDVVGLGVIVPGRSQVFHVFYGNRGNVDAIGVPLWIGGIPAGSTVQIATELTDPMQPAGAPPVDYSTVPVTVPTSQGLVVPLFISRIPSGSSGAIQLRITVPTAQPFQLQAWANPPFYGSPLHGEVSECLFCAALKVIGLVPGSKCAKAFLSVLTDSLDAAVHLNESTPPAAAIFPLSKLFYKVVREAAICAAEITGGEISIVYNIIDEVLKVKSDLGCMVKCVIAFDQLTTFTSHSVQTVGSFDPNDKVGSQGAGPERYVSGHEPLRYSIHCENAPTATAPAQTVTISDQLDLTKIDPATFSFGPIVFGDVTFVPPALQTSFSHDLDLRPGQSLIVRITAAFNPNSGAATWTFTSIDPATGDLPENPLVGFLPPNVSAPQGEASVLYTVNPRADLPTGTVVTNAASIVFDLNPALMTPTWFNTFDNTKPQSAMVPLAAVQTSPVFQLQWVGTDEGAGIKDYTVLVSDNDGPFAPVVQNTPETSLLFTGTAGHRYRFYSVARDAAGNIEANDTPSLVTTTLQSDSTPPVLQLPANLVLEASGPSGAIATFGASASDDHGGNVPVQLDHTSGSVFPLGVTTVTASATDQAGNRATGSFTVTVHDTTPPEIAAPANIGLEATGPAGAAATFAAHATDLVDGDVAVTSNPGSGATFPLGSTSVTLTAIDSAHNAGTASFTVTVRDTTPPQLIVPNDLTMDAPNASGGPVTFVASATDLVSGACTVTISPPSGSVFPIGSTVVTATASDAADNAETRTFTVTLRAPATALVNRLSSMNGRIVGSVQQRLPEDVTLNGNANISGDLLVVGTPTLRQNGHPAFGGTVDGSGSMSPSNYTVTLNGNASLGRLVRRMNPPAWPSVAAPASPSGTRNVTLNKAGDPVGSWSTLRDLTLNGNAGTIAVPPGAYGSFTANGSGNFVLGVAGETIPAVYQFQSLTLNGNAALQIAGPVIVVVKNGIAANGTLGNGGQPHWLDLRISNGGLTLNGNVAVYGDVTAPTGTVTLNGSSSLTGGVAADKLVLNGNGLLTLVRR